MNWRLSLELVGKFVLLMSLTVGGFLLYVSLEDVPFGVQTATGIAYTAAVYCFVFFRWKGLPHSYSLRDRAVQRQLPRLLAIHLGFLLFVLALMTALKSHTLRHWLGGRGLSHHSIAVNAFVCVNTLTFFSQVLISRSILRRRNSKSREFTG